jgi:hypothetical protein
MTDTRDTAAPQWWKPLPEDADERRMFDSSAQLHGDVRLSIANMLRIFAVANPGGSYAEQCRIAANEVVKLNLSASPTAPPPTQPEAVPRLPNANDPDDYSITLELATQPEAQQAWMEEARERIDDLVCASNAAVLYFARHKSTPEYHRLKDLCDAAEDALLAHLRTKGE